MVGLQQELAEAQASLEEGGRRHMEAEGRLQLTAQELERQRQAVQLRQQQEDAAYAPPLPVLQPCTSKECAQYAQC